MASLNRPFFTGVYQDTSCRHRTLPCCTLLAPGLTGYFPNGFARSQWDCQLLLAALPVGAASKVRTTHYSFVRTPQLLASCISICSSRIKLHFDEVNSAEHWHLGFGIKCCHKNTVRRNQTVSAQRQWESVVCLLRGSDSPPGYVRLSLSTWRQNPEEVCRAVG